MLPDAQKFNPYAIDVYQPGQIQVIELLKCTGVLVENEDGNLVSPVK
jgi:hypothetical protein